MRTGAANDLKTVGGCLKDLDHLCCVVTFPLVLGLVVLVTPKA